MQCSAKQMHTCVKAYIKMALGQVTLEILHSPIWVVAAIIIFS